MFTQLIFFFSNKIFVCGNCTLKMDLRSTVFSRMLWYIFFQLWQSRYEYVKLDIVISENSCYKKVSQKGYDIHVHFKLVFDFRNLKGFLFDLTYTAARNISNSGWTLTEQVVWKMAHLANFLALHLPDLKIKTLG